jgi:hypothetical protein
LHIYINADITLQVRKGILRELYEILEWRELLSLYADTKNSSRSPLTVQHCLQRSLNIL